MWPLMTLDTLISGDIYYIFFTLYLLVSSVDLFLLILSLHRFLTTVVTLIQPKASIARGWSISAILQLMLVFGSPVTILVWVAAIHRASKDSDKLCSMVGQHWTIITTTAARGLNAQCSALLSVQARGLTVPAACPPDSLGPLMLTIAPSRTS